MEFKKPEAPPAWKVWGYLPVFDDITKLSDDELCELEQDLVQITLPGGKKLLDVGWYPDWDREGSFCCVIVENYDWDNPVEEFDTSNPYEVLDWLQKTINKLKDRENAR